MAAGAGTGVPPRTTLIRLDQKGDNRGATRDNEERIGNTRARLVWPAGGVDRGMMLRGISGGVLPRADAPLDFGQQPLGREWLGYDAARRRDTQLGEGGSGITRHQDDG